MITMSLGEYCQTATQSPTVGRSPGSARNNSAPATSALVSPDSVESEYVCRCCARMRAGFSPLPAKSTKCWAQDSFHPANCKCIRYTPIRLRKQTQSIAQQGAKTHLEP